MMTLAKASLLFLLGALAACEPQYQGNQMPASTTGLDAAARNGARIYFTSVSDRGSGISYSGGPSVGGMMMGSMGNWLTCAACHGPEGRGGIHLMHMSVMKAPDIRYAALKSMPEMRERSRPYEFSDFRRSVVEGRHPDGDELGSNMPRWHMSEADLQDLFAFLRSLPQ